MEFLVDMGTMEEENCKIVPHLIGWLVLLFQAF